ncbi:hypothetical protein AG4045_020631 [Apium graveolens]|uniref:Uncharacterized protein n=1 Tax=Apium graveolens TaxID=4045 RepID=A0A6L5B6W0_APIGR|nr:hypothetical protein AG4045_020631 [Apium graveolens]
MKKKAEKEGEKAAAAEKVREEHEEQAARDRQHDLEKRIAEDTELAVKKAVTVKRHSTKPNPATGTHGGTIKPFIPPRKVGSSLEGQKVKEATKKQYTSSTKLEVAKMKKQKTMGKQPK